MTGDALRGEAKPDARPALGDVSYDAWRELATRAAEPNAYLLPDWARAIAASARGGTGSQALTAWQGHGTAARLIGLIPTISLWRACRLPFSALANCDPHISLGTPLLDRAASEAAAAGLLHNARQAGARALLLRHVTIDGPMMHAFRTALARDGLAPIILESHVRAFLDATRNADELLQDALGSSKLKQLRRLRKRLSEQGAIRFETARTPEAVAATLPVFLDLEASGWKGAQGSALKQHPGNLAFITRATAALAAQGQCEIATLWSGDVPVASGIVLRHGSRAYYFKIGVDPDFAKYSVGVQLTLDVTRHLCADPMIDTADSTASPNHPMIDPIWRGRLAIGDVLIPLRRRDPWVALIHPGLLIYNRVRKGVRALRKRLRR